MTLSQSTTNLVIRVLRGRLTRHVYTGRLPGERALAAELGTNPRTIENALMRLEVIGLVRRKARSGTYPVPAEDRPKTVTPLFTRLVLRNPLLPQGDADFWASLIIYGFQTAAQAQGISMSFEHAKSVDETVEEVVREAGSTACVGTCVLSMPVEMRHALHLAASRCNVVLADWDIEEPILPCVNFDNVGAGRLAAQHLMQLGHRRIAMLAQTPFSPSTRDRLAGAQRFLNDWGIKLRTAEYPREGFHGAFDSLMSSSEPPTAILSGHPGAAEVFVELAAARGLAVPKTLSMMTFGEPRMHQRRITRAATDHEGLGRKAFECLLDEELMARPRRVLVPVHLVDGQTTAAPAPS